MEEHSADEMEGIQSEFIGAHPRGYRRGWRRGGGGGFLGPFSPGRLFRRGLSPLWGGLSLAAWTLRRGLWYPWWYWLPPEYYEYRRPVAVTYADGTVRYLVPPYPPGNWGRYAPPPGGFREQPAMYAGQPMCDHCELKPIATQCGGGCEMAYYCGQECADAHFAEHQEECRGCQ